MFRTVLRCLSTLGPALAAVPVFAASAGAAAPGAPASPAPYHELTAERSVVALTPGLENEALAAVLDRLEAAGVRVPVAVSGAGLILVDGPELDAALAREGITRVLREPAGAAARAASDPRAAGLLAWWDGGFVAPEPAGAAARVQADLCRGARTLDEAVTQRGPFRCGPRDYGTVHFAAGRCIVNLILPDGAQSAWNGADVVSVEAENLRALNWWNLKSARSLSFVVVNHGVVPTDEEPALLPSDQEDLYIEDCLTNLGYTNTNCPYGQVGDLNAATRDRNGGHWAYTQFILNANVFPDGSFLAYAYLGGPLTVALLGNASLGPQYLDRVIAHEMGHIFQAADEYAGCGGCAGAFGYLDAPNGNCADCNPGERCVMRGSGEYSIQDMQNMETVIQPCEYTKRMTGIWDSDGDGIWDVRETYPSSVFTTAVPETLDTPRNFRIAGTSWDVPFPAPARFGTPVTINRILQVQFRVDGGEPGQARAVDGLFTGVREDWELALPDLGGGPHTLQLTAQNSVFFTDPTPPQLSFFVWDVKLREDLFALPEAGAMAVTWRVDGEDFGSTYSLYRREAGSDVESLLGTVPSQGGRNDRFVFWDRKLRAGREYVYRLVVDIPDKGSKELGLVRQEAMLSTPPPGRIAAVAPNPSRGEILLSVSVPRGPKAGVDDILIPGGGASGGFRGEEENPGGGPAADTPWRDVRIAIYDVRGRIVRDLGVFRHQELTRFNAAWDGRYRDGTPAPAGVYFARIGLDYTHSIEKLVLIR
jgi:hypothetical protein